MGEAGQNRGHMDISIGAECDPTCGNWGQVIWLRVQEGSPYHRSRLRTKETAWPQDKAKSKAHLPPRPSRLPSCPHPIHAPPMSHPHPSQNCPLPAHSVSCPTMVPPSALADVREVQHGCNRTSTACSTGLVALAPMLWCSISATGSLKLRCPSCYCYTTYTGYWSTSRCNSKCW